MPIKCGHRIEMMVAITFALGNCFKVVRSSFLVAWRMLLLYASYGSSCERVVAVSVYMHQRRSSGVIRANANCSHRPNNSRQFTITGATTEASLGDGLLRAHGFEHSRQAKRGGRGLALRGDGGVGGFSEHRGFFVNRAGVSIALALATRSAEI
jgi:hypothetical protein